MFKNKYNEFRSGWSIFILFISIFMVQILVGIMVGIVAIMTSGFSNISAYEPVVASLMTRPFINLLPTLFTGFMAMLLFKIIYNRPFRQMGLSAQNWLQQLLGGCLFGIASISIVFGILVLSGQASVTSVSVATVTDPAFLTSFLRFVLIGFSEEILARGFLMTALKTTRNKIAIFTVSAVIFSVLHLFNPSVGILPLVNIFLVGLLLAYMFIKTGDIFLCIGFHITWNFFQGNIFGMNVSGITTVPIINTRFLGPDFITGGGFGPEGGIVVTLVTILGLAYVHFVMKPPQSPVWTMDSDLPLIRGILVVHPVNTTNS